MQDELNKEKAEGAGVNLEKIAEAETEVLKVEEGINTADEILASAKEEAEKSEKDSSEKEVAEEKKEEAEKKEESKTEESKTENEVSNKEASEEKKDEDKDSSENKEDVKEASIENKDSSEDNKETVEGQKENSEEPKAPAQGANDTAKAPAEEIKNEPAIFVSVQEESVGREIYSWLNYGVTHMLPFGIAGGILIVIAYLIDTIAGYSLAGDVNFGSVTPVAAILKYIGELAFGMMIPVLAGYIAKAIAGKPGFAVGIIGGLFASLGNIALAGYSFAEGKFIDGTALGGFSQFVSKWAFQQSYGGYTGSGFLGGIAAGFLAGFIVLGLEKICDNLPEESETIKTTIIYPIAGIFFTGIIMCFVINPFVGLINDAVYRMLATMYDVGMVAFLGLILGALVALDLNGAFKKAAYVFGIKMLSTASVYFAGGTSVDDPEVQVFYVAMAAIMVGTMVPAVGVGLASLIFSKKFTKEEKCSAIPNFLMGISGITEGAIPIAAADPLRTIPSAVVGAAVAGFLVAQFKCTVTVPFGGLFVITGVGNPIVFIVAWLVGSAITCVMLGLLKKEVEE